MTPKRLLTILAVVLLNGVFALTTLTQLQTPLAREAGMPLRAFASAQQGAAECRYIYPDGEVSGPLNLALEECAKVVLDETIRLGLAEGFGLYDKYALRVTASGDVYAAYTEDVRSVDDLEWQYLGNLNGVSSGQPQPDTRSNPPRGAQTSGTTPAGGSEQIDDTPGTVPTSLRQIFDIAAEDIDDFWDETFKDFGFDYQTPEIVLFESAQVRSGCGVAPAQVGPFYCNIDHTMYYPAGFMERQWELHGDYAVVTIIAHEWGHAVQNLLGGLNTGDYTITIELEADCFAGAYTAYANGESTKIRLDQSDIEEGATALFYAGDPDGTPWYDSRAHGTGDQRYEAFMVGFKDGVTACGR
ncbi:MAG: neutral zinc metallopeptidase [Chloroflexota bacterium]|nr:neutral zinc metallopeptidase [Chloroflexota bacterium]